nr:hypothetical protein [bacterium]
YIRGGSLAPITLGYGLIMRRYTNAIEWPQVRRIGLQTEINSGPYKIEALLNNFRELESPGLVGGRFSYSTKFVLPVVVGGTLMFDGNQYLGLDDEDGDGIPDRHDMFPGETDQDIINELRNVFLRNEALLTRLINQNILPDIRNPTKNFKDDDEAVVEFGVDVGIPLIQNKVMSLWAYAQAAQIVDYGRGYTFPGLTWKMGPFRAGVEYRIFEKEFVSDFFGLSYEIERVEWDEDADDGQGKYVTKEEKLDGIRSGQGYYVDAGADIFGYLDIYGSYQNMIYDDSEIPNQSLYAKATLNTSFIPKIDLAEGYFQQPNADKVFSTDQDGTIIGYKVGASLGAGVMLVYDNKTIYHNGEPNRIMTVETVMKFK